jgi:hypothetical protein
LFEWLQGTAVAKTIGASSNLTGLISGLHLLGMTLVVGGAVVSSLRLLGAILRRQPLRDTIVATDRGMAAGLALSIITGILLFSPRATQIVQNELFQLKMSVLVAAAVFHLAVRVPVTRRPSPGSVPLKIVGGVGLILWVGLAVAACAFILLE